MTHNIDAFECPKCSGVIYLDAELASISAPVICRCGYRVTQAVTSSDAVAISDHQHDTPSPPVDS